MFQTEACVKCFFSDTDTEHITLSCMVNSFDTVDIVMELTLDNRFEIRLHVLSGNFYNICNAVLASQFHFIYIRTNDSDLMVFDLGSIYSLYQLGTVYTGSVELYLHVAAADDLAFKCGSECYRDINICDLDLNVTGFQRSSVEFAYIRLADQALRNFCNTFLVCDYREA